MRFDLTILGCHSATPGKNRFPSAQVLHVNHCAYLIDCGEASQIRMEEFNIKRNKINQIFISHLHGDHTFGLAGLLTSFSLAGRSAPMDIFSPPGLEEMIRTQLRVSESFESFEIRFHQTNPEKNELIFEDKNVRVFTIPLLHRIPANGFLFLEKEKPRNIIADFIDKYNIPYEEIRAIKNGGDFLTEDNTIIPNEKLTRPATPPRSFAYCSDTVFKPDIVPLIQGVDLLYHETTFLEKDSELAVKTMHSTAIQAAKIAHLANVGCLIVGHFSGRYKDTSLFISEAKAVFANTVLGETGGAYQVLHNVINPA